jgi:dTDP-4-dehydrorhamnose reductase
LIEDAVRLRRLRPVVLGADGRAGRAIADVLSSHAPSTVAAGRLELDAADYFNLRWELERLEVDLVINAVAMAEVDACEADPARAQFLNAQVAGDVARAAHESGAALVHLSTDYVFAGDGGAPYSEGDPTLPLSVYGKSKRAGELMVLLAHPDALLVRTASLFGGHGKRPDFVERILGDAVAGAILPVVQDQVGNPTAVGDLARGLVELLAGGVTGVVHLAGSGGVSRAEFAQAILDEAGRPDVEVEPVASDEVVPGRAPRPADSRLDTSLFTRLTGSPPRAWREGLREVLVARRDEDASS